MINWIKTKISNNVIIYHGKSEIHKVFLTDKIYIDVVKKLFIDICIKNNIDKNNYFFIITDNLNKLDIICFTSDQNDNILNNILSHYNFNLTSLDNILNFIILKNNFIY